MPQDRRRRAIRCRISVCTSSSVGTAGLIDCDRYQRIGLACFTDQHLERRHISVPFDQGWHRTETAQRLLA